MISGGRDKVNMATTFTGYQYMLERIVSCCMGEIPVETHYTLIHLLDILLGLLPAHYTFQP